MPSNVFGTFALLVSAGFVLLAGCEKMPISQNFPLTARAAGKQLADIADGKISGKLGETAFTAMDVKLRVETMAGHERVDLLISTGRLEHCGLPNSNTDTRVWVRWTGTVPTDGTPQRVEAGQHSPMSVSYEMWEDGRWVSHGGGAALVSITKRFGGYTGKVWICFDDGHDSCVTGTFHGTECRSELDVDDSVWGAGRAETPTPTPTPTSTPTSTPTPTPTPTKRAE